MSVTLDVDDEPTPGLAADGRPDPAYAAALGLVPAPAGRRSAAFALDAAVWVVLALPGRHRHRAAPGRRRRVGRRGRRRGLGGRRVPPRAHRRQPGAPGGVRPHAAGAARPHGPHPRQGGVRHPLGRRRRVRPGGLLADHAACARAVGGAGAPPVRRPGGAVRVVRLGSRAARAQLARPDRRMLRTRRAGRPRPVRRTGAPARAPRGGAPAGRRHVARCRRSPATAHPTSTPSSRRRGRVPPWWRPGSGSGSRPCSPHPRRRPAPAAAATPAAAPASSSIPDTASPPAAGAFLLRFDDGTAVAAAPRGLLGRAPADIAGRAPAEGEGRTPAVLVPLSDDSMRISKTHAEFGVTDGRFWVADRASKNGTVVELPGGAERSLGAGERIELPVGSAVRLGGRRFTVERSTQG